MLHTHTYRNAHLLTLYYILTYTTLHTHPHHTIYSRKQQYILIETTPHIQKQDTANSYMYIQPPVYFHASNYKSMNTTLHSPTYHTKHVLRRTNILYNKPAHTHTPHYISGTQHNTQAPHFYRIFSISIQNYQLISYGGLLDTSTV
jgi:hypothetical protein